MSDVMKAIRNIDLGLDRIGYLEPGAERDEVIRDLQIEAAGAYPILRDHIGALHSAIARLKGEYKTNVISPAAFEDLFALLPTDWAGETE